MGAYNLPKNRTLGQMFSCGFWEMTWDTYFVEHL